MLPFVHFIKSLIRVPNIVTSNFRLRHRGPDWSGVHVQGNNVFAHERLAIVGIDSGSQPLLSKDKSTVLVVNGEIYNHKELRAQLRQLHAFQTESDCEVLMYLVSCLFHE